MGQAKWIGVSMRPEVAIPLVGIALAAGCDSAQSDPPLPEAPSPEALAACEGEDMGDTDFDWSCCDVWYQQCMAEGRGEEECMWICNG